MKRAIWTGVALLALVLSLSCAAGPNAMSGTTDEAGRVAGFWLGLWQGFILLFSFVVSLFNDSVQVYEVHNSGPLYNLGFVLGVMMFFGGGGKSARKRRRRRD